jgi:hypothetical protein
VDVNEDEIRKDRIVLISGMVLFLVGFSPWWLLYELNLRLGLDITVACGFGFAGLVGFFIMIPSAVFYLEHVFWSKKRTVEGVAEAYGFYGTLSSVLAALITLAEMLASIWTAFSVLMIIATLSFLGLFMGIHGIRLKWNLWVTSAMFLGIEVIVVQILYVFFGMPTLGFI